MPDNPPLPSLPAPKPVNPLKRETRVLLTGAWGVLGMAVQQHLKDHGFSQVLVPRRSHLDLTDHNATALFIQKHEPQCVIHLASVVHGLGGNQEFQMSSLEQNTLINHNLLSALGGCPPEQIFFAGTVASYPYPFPPMPLEESTFFDGLCHDGEFGYAMAKRHAYAYLRIQSERTRARFCYGIFTNLYGAHDRFNIRHGHVIPSLIAKAHRSARDGHSLEVWGDGTAEREFLHADDAARAILMCLEACNDNSLVNISSGKSVSIAHVASTLARIAGTPSITFLTDKPTGIVRRVMDTSRLRAIGFVPRIDIDAGLETTYAWYDRNHEEARQ